MTDNEFIDEYIQGIQKDRENLNRKMKFTQGLIDDWSSKMDVSEWEHEKKLYENLDDLFGRFIDMLEDLK